MEPHNSSDLSVETLLSLRGQEDAIRIITERLGVKEMGPADHIRTKHEVKAFVEAGETKAAEILLKRANERRAENISLREKISVRHSQSIGK